MAHFAAFFAEFGQKTDPKAYFSLVFTKTSMKQTNNAIKFLMAQYRAIFKSAYFKGLTSAVLLTAGLAAGAAQAAEVNIEWGNSIEAPADAATISGADNTVTLSGDKFISDLTVNGTVSFSGSDAASGGRVIVTKSMSLNDANLTLTTAANGSGIFGAHQIKPTEEGAGQPLFTGGNTSFVADKSTLNIKSGGLAILFTNMTLNDSNVTIESGSGIGAEVGEVTTADGFDYTKGVLTINGGTYTLQSGGWMYGTTVNLNDATITLGTSGGDSANIFTAGNSGYTTGVLNITDTSLSVVSGGKSWIGGNITNLNDGAVITTQGTLVLGKATPNSVINIHDGATVQLNTTATGHIFAQGDIVMDGGNLTLAPSDGNYGLIGISTSDDYDATLDEPFDTDLTATGGNITVTKSQIQMNNITLGGDVQVTIGTHIGDADSYWTDNAIINAEDNNDGTSGILTINGADITMNAGSSIMGRNVIMTDGSISLNGSDDAYDTNESGSAMVIAYGNTSKLDLQGGEITVATDKFGAIRGKTINLSGVNITNNGELTIAGLLDKSNSGANVVATDGQAIFNMTAGSINNAGILNLGVVSGSGVDNKSSSFTFAGGTITNSDTINVGSGASFNTAGTFNLAGTTGTLNLLSGSSATLGGENVTLTGILDAQSGSTVKVTGKVDFNGDGSNASGNLVDLKIANSGDFTIDSTGTFSIADAEQTIGLTVTAAAGESGNTFTVSGGTGFAGFNSGSTGVLYVDVTGVSGLADYLTGSDGNYTMSAADFTAFANALKTELANSADSKLTINLDGVSVALADDAIDETTNSTTYDEIKDVVSSGVTPENLQNTAVDVTGATDVTGSFGQAQVAAAGSVAVSGKNPLTLNGHKVNGTSTGTALVQAGTGDTATVGGATLKAGSQLNLNVQNGTGTIGSITTTLGEGADSAGEVVVNAGSTIAVVATTTTVNSVKDGITESTRLGDIGTAAAQVSKVSTAGALTAQDVYAKEASVNGGGVLTVDSLNTTTTTVESNGQVAVTDFTTANADVKAGASVAVTDTFTAANATIAGTVQADSAELGVATVDGGVLQDITSLEVTDSLTLTNDATATVNTLTVGAGASVNVGNGEVANGSATMFAQNIEFDEGSDWFKVDPAWGTKASVVGVAQFGATTTTDLKGDAGVLEGKAAALQNSILAVGVTVDANTEAYIRDLFAQYTDPTTGSLKQGDVGSIVYVEGSLNLASGAKLVADSNYTGTSFENAMAEAGNAYAAQISANDVYIGANSALAINTDAAIQDADNNRAAIVFNKTGTANANIYSNGGKVVLVGDNLTSKDNLKLFGIAGGTTGTVQLNTVNDQGLRVESLNGLMYYTLTNDNVTDSFTLQLDRTRVDSVFNDVSSPVKNTLISYAADYNDWNAKTPVDQLHGAATGLTYTPAAGGNQATITDEAGTNYNVADYVVINRGTAEEPNYVVYDKAYNALLDDIVMNQSNARDAETVARFSAFGGVAQSAMAAGAATYDAISGRMGVGANGTNITVADNMQGAAIWLTPVYKSSEADGFDADGLDYGVDVDLYGVALGADYTLANGLRFGAMFNVGSGEVDGKDLGSNVSNDFDYYGFGAYVGYSFAAFSIVGDISYTAVDNDVEANLLNGGKLSESLDSSNFSVGVTGQYQVDTGSVLVTPHAGLRYSSIDVDDYTIADAANVDSDDLGIFSIPVGVTIATEFTSNEWTIKPSFDFTVTGNFGDDSTDGTVHWAGVENLSTSVSSEVIDSFTYGATLGLGVQNGNFGLGLGVNYTGSSNTDEFGVQANARFVF